MRRYLSKFVQQTLGSTTGAEGLVSQIKTVNTDLASNPELFHRSITARLREPGTRARNRVRKTGWYV